MCPLWECACTWWWAQCHPAKCTPLIRLKFDFYDVRYLCIIDTWFSNSHEMGSTVATSCPFSKESVCLRYSRSQYWHISCIKLGKFSKMRNTALFCITFDKVRFEGPRLSVLKLSPGNVNLVARWLFYPKYILFWAAFWSDVLLVFLYF